MFDLGWKLNESSIRSWKDRSIFLWIVQATSNSFMSIEDAKEKIKSWRRDYNLELLHGSLDFVTHLNTLHPCGFRHHHRRIWCRSFYFCLDQIPGDGQEEVRKMVRKKVLQSKPTLEATDTWMPRLESAWLNTVTPLKSNSLLRQ
jgi:hypothetical protein